MPKCVEPNSHSDVAQTRAQVQPVVHALWGSAWSIAEYMSYGLWPVEVSWLENRRSRQLENAVAPSMPKAWCSRSWLFSSTKAAKRACCRSTLLDAGVVAARTCCGCFA